MLLERSSGVLLHPTSLPGRFGIGDLGPQARRFVDWLAAAGQQLWQVLPLGPTGDDFSPYQSLSASALNPLLVSPRLLAEDRLVDQADLDRAAAPPDAKPGRVDFARVAGEKDRLLQTAAARFRRLPQEHPFRADFARFCERHASWLDDHAMFLALREANGRRAWWEWSELVTPDKRPVAGAADALAERIELQRIAQWLLHRQWDALRRYARGRGVRLIGDLPIYVAHDSTEVWAHRELFQLDVTGQPTLVAGVPPDYFSATGQLWNNPVYDWPANAREGYRWWIARVGALLELVDFARVDHFRGFEAFWAVPAGEPTAEDGQWRPGPGAELFDALRLGLSPPPAEGDGLAPLPLIAEDLGYITPEVIELRRQLGLPGMEVLQFLWNYDEERFVPPTDFDRDTVVYTGTHDNNTTRGWFEQEVLRDPPLLERLRRHTRAAPETIAWDLIELAWGSSAAVAVAPLQDVLSLGPEARMNKPGTRYPEHPNWSWRVAPAALAGELAERLSALTGQTGRGRMSPSAKT
jgi:4-alpha-glucanotransferase